MKGLGGVLFVLLCVVALALVVVTVLVLAGVGVKDNSSATPSARERSSSGRRSLPGSAILVRFGGASNVDVLFAGEPVQVPSGTVAVVLSRPARL